METSAWRERSTHSAAPRTIPPQALTQGWTAGKDATFLSSGGILSRTAIDGDVGCLHLSVVDSRMY